jgi:hypothetical protein
VKRGRTLVTRGRARRKWACMEGSGHARKEPGVHRKDRAHTSEWRGVHK